MVKVEMGLPCMFTRFSLCPAHSYFAQGLVIAKIDEIPCAILELSGTIPETADKVGILRLRRYNSGIVPILTLRLTYIFSLYVCYMYKVQIKYA